MFQQLFFEQVLIANNDVKITFIIRRSLDLVGRTVRYSYR